MPGISNGEVQAWVTDGSPYPNDTGFCITNTSNDDGPTVNVYVKDNQIVGLLVYEYPDGDLDGVVLGRWGMVPSHLVESM